jgi:hypothetical protein
MVSAPFATQLGSRKDRAHRPPLLGVKEHVLWYHNPARLSKAGLKLLKRVKPCISHG